MKQRNTLKKGQTRFLVFKDGVKFFGVALELNIVVEGDSPEETYVLLLDAIQGYVNAARKVKLRDSVLNQKPYIEYEQMWEGYISQKLKEKYEKIINKLPIFQAGRMALTSS